MTFFLSSDFSFSLGFFIKMDTVTVKPKTSPSHPGGRLQYSF